MKSQFKKIIFAFLSLIFFVGVIFGSFTIYSKIDKEAKGWIFQDSTKNNFLLNNSSDYLNYDYSFIKTQGEEDKVVAKYIPPQTKNNPKDFGVVLLPNQSKQIPVNDFVHNFKMKNKEYPLFKIRTSYFNFDNRYLVAISPDDWARFVWWFVGKNSKEGGSLSYGPEAGALETLEIVPGVSRASSGSVTKGSYKNKGESATITYYPDSFFGSFKIYEKTLWSQAPKKLTNALFVTRRQPTSGWKFKNFGKESPTNFQNEFSIKEIHNILELINKISQSNDFLKEISNLENEKAEKEIDKTLNKKNLIDYGQKIKELESQINKHNLELEKLLGMKSKPQKQIDNLNLELQKMNFKLNDLNKKIQIEKTLISKSKNKIKKLIKTFKEIQKNPELKGSYGLMGQNALTPRLLLFSSFKFVNGKKTPFYKILGEHFTLRDDDPTKKSLLDTLKEMFPEDLTKFNGPYIHKNSKGEFSIKIGENYEFTDSLTIGLPKILKAINPDFQGMGFDFLKYTSLHEYGHHQTLTDTYDSSHTGVIAERLISESPVKRFAFDSVQSYLNARSKGLNVVRVNPHGELLKKNEEELSSSPFLKFRLPNGQVEKQENIIGHYKLNKDNVWKPDNVKNDREYYRAFKDGLEDLRKEYVEKYNKKNPKHHTTLYNAFIMNALDDKSITLNPKFYVYGYEKAPWTRSGSENMFNYYYLSTFNKDIFKEIETTFQFFRGLRTLQSIIPANLISEKLLYSYYNMHYYSTRKKFKRNWHPSEIYEDIHKAWIQKEAGQTRAKPLFWKLIDSYLEIYNSNESWRSKFNESQKNTIEKLKLNIWQINRIWRKKTLSDFLKQFLNLEARTIELKVGTESSTLDFVETNLASNIKKYVEIFKSHLSPASYTPVTFKQLKEQLTLMKNKDPKTTILENNHFYKQLEKISKLSSEVETTFTTDQKKFFPNIKSNHFPMVQKLWKKSYLEKNFSVLFNKFFKFDPNKTMKRKIAFSKVNADRKIFFDFKNKIWKDWFFVLSNLKDKGPKPKPILEKYTGKEKADVNLWRDKGIFVNSNIWDCRFNLIDVEKILDKKGNTFFNFFANKYLSKYQKSQMQEKPEIKVQFKEQAKNFYLQNILEPVLDRIIHDTSVSFKVTGTRNNSALGAKSVNSAITDTVFSDYLFSFAETMTRDYVQIIFALDNKPLKNTNRFLSFSSATSGMSYVLNKSLTEKYNLKDVYANNYFSTKIASIWLNLFDLKLSNEWNNLNEFQKRFYEKIKNPDNHIKVIFSSWLLYNETFGSYISDDNSFIMDKQHRAVLDWGLYNEDGLEKTKDVEHLRILGPRGQKPKTWAEAYWFFLLQIKGIGLPILQGRNITNVYRLLKNDKIYIWGYFDSQDKNFVKDRPQYLVFKNQNTQKISYQKIFYHNPKKMFYLKKQANIDTKHTLEDEGFVGWSTQKFSAGNYNLEFLNSGTYEVYFANKDFFKSTTKLSIGDKKYIAENNKSPKIATTKFFKGESGKILFQVKRRFSGLKG